MQIVCVCVRSLGRACLQIFMKFFLLQIVQLAHVLAMSKAFKLSLKAYQQKHKYSDVSDAWLHIHAQTCFFWKNRIEQKSCVSLAIDFEPSSIFTSPRKQKKRSFFCVFFINAYQMSVLNMNDHRLYQNDLVHAFEMFKTQDEKRITNQPQTLIMPI